MRRTCLCGSCLERLDKHPSLFIVEVMGKPPTINIKPFTSQSGTQRQLKNRRLCAKHRERTWELWWFPFDYSDVGSAQHDERKNWCAKRNQATTLFICVHLIVVFGYSILLVFFSFHDGTPTNIPIRTKLFKETLL